MAKGYYRSSNGRYIVRFRNQGKWVYGGSFETPQEALLAYQRHKLHLKKYSWGEMKVSRKLSQMGVNFALLSPGLVTEKHKIKVKCSNRVEDDRKRFYKTKVNPDEFDYLIVLLGKAKTDVYIIPSSECTKDISISYFPTYESKYSQFLDNWPIFS